LKENQGTKFNSFVSEKFILIPGDISQRRLEFEGINYRRGDLQ
jgi:hypothetical protein